MQEKIIINDVEYTILVKFTSENTNKDYIIYSTLEPHEHIIDVYAGIINDNRIEEVNTKEEQQIIEKMISTIATTPGEKYKLVSET